MNLMRRAILAITLIAGIAPAIAQVPPPVPGLPDAERRTAFTLSASTCACSVGFALYGDSTDYQNWVEVFVNGALVNYNDPISGWTITSPTGPLAKIARPITDAVLTFNSAQTGTIQIVGARRPRRVSQFNENMGVPARNLNQVLTDLTAQNREVWDKINDVTGRAVLAPPGETISLLPAMATRANQNACFDANGNLINCASVSGTFYAGAGILFTGSNPTTISAIPNNPNVVAPLTKTGTNPIVLSCPTCNTSPNSGAAPFPSRAAAALIDLSAYSTITTQGYATAGDGGGAVFQKVGAVPFQDTYIQSGTIAGGSGYTNGTYNNIPLSGGSGVGCAGQVVVSGNAVTAVNISIPCAAYAVGDVLSTTNSFLGGGSGFTYTVTVESTALASFADAAGNKWQYVVDSGSFPNVRQFGAVLNWNGSDASATNDRPSFMSAIAFASIPYTAAGAIVTGNSIIVPKGASLICGGANGATLPIPQGVTLRGAGVYGGTTLKQCTAEPSTNHFIQLCEIYTNFGQFGCALKDLALLADGASAANIAAIYSISGQQFALVDNVYIQPGNRGCIVYDYGKGGAANAIFKSFDCETLNTITNPSMLIGSNVGGTLVTIRDAVFGCSPSLCTHSAITVAGTGAQIILDGVHIEGTSTGITMGPTGLSVLRNFNVVSPCTTAVVLQANNPNNTTMIENLSTGCTTAVSNGHSGGSSVTGSILAQRVFNP